MVVAEQKIFLQGIPTIEEYLADPQIYRDHMVVVQLRDNAGIAKPLVAALSPLYLRPIGSTGRYGSRYPLPYWQIDEHGLPVSDFLPPLWHEDLLELVADIRQTPYHVEVLGTISSSRFRDTRWGGLI